MLSQVLRTIRRHELFSPGDGVLVAVSGGPDSMAMLATLWELSARLRLRLEVATVDHGLRPAAAEEAALVAARAAALELPWHRLPVDVPGVRARTARARGAGTPPEGRGLQAVARRLRLDALAGLAAARGLTRVALGHTADDQTETVLFRVLRGTGLRGLAGIPYRRGVFVRPLLDVTRTQVLAYLRRRSLPFAQDPSNADPRFARARLRHRILPLLRAENPRVDEALRALAAEAAALGSADQAADDAVLHEVTDRRGSLFVHRRVAAEIRAAVSEARGSRRFDVGGGSVTVAYGRATVTPRGGRIGATSSAPAVAPTDPALNSTEIGAAGRYQVGGGFILEVVTSETAPESPAPAGTGGDTPAWFDAEGVDWPLTVRARRPGERMRPRGGRGSRKLSDLMVDAKLPRARRSTIPVLTDGAGRVLSVPGLRPAEFARPAEGTRRFVGLIWRTSTLNLDALSDEDNQGGGAVSRAAKPRRSRG